MTTKSDGANPSDKPSYWPHPDEVDADFEAVSRKYTIQFPASRISLWKMARELYDEREQVFFSAAHLGDNGTAHRCTTRLDAIAAAIGKEELDRALRPLREWWDREWEGLEKSIPACIRCGAKRGIQENYLLPDGHCDRCAGECAWCCP